MVISTPKYQVSAVTQPSLYDVEWGDRVPVFQQSSKVWAQNLHKSPNGTAMTWCFFFNKANLPGGLLT